MRERLRNAHQSGDGHDLPALTDRAVVRPGSGPDALPRQRVAGRDQCLADGQADYEEGVRIGLLRQPIDGAKLIGAVHRHRDSGNFLGNARDGAYPGDLPGRGDSVLLACGIPQDEGVLREIDELHLAKAPISSLPPNLAFQLTTALP